MEKYNNILITGGLGFIGSNFINYIYEKTTSNIINIDKCNYCSNLNNIEKKIQNSSRYKLYTYSLSNEKIITKILEKHNIDLIVHFAAQSHVTLSFSNTDEFIQDNIVSSYYLLQSIKNYGKIKLFLNISTDEVYGETNLNNNNQKKETDILNPTNPYSATKACVEMLTNSFVYSYNLPLITLRCNNVYGKNQYFEKVIPKFIRQLNENKKLTIEGSGNHKRTFVHVHDVCNAIITIINNGIVNNIYNIGNNNDEYSIIDLAKLLILKIHNTTKYENYIEYINERPYDDNRYFINYDKIMKLSWKPTKVFNEEIDNLILHYINKN